MRVIVVILTCDRLELTKKTVKSFLGHNNRDNFDIYYGDDASIDPATYGFMKRQGIPCLMKHKKRRGCSPSSDELVHLACAASDAPYVLYLQNDFESVRPIPLDIVQQIFDDHPKVGWIRLYGLHKNDTISGGNTTDPLNKFRKGSPKVKWDEFEVAGERLGVGDAQWSYNPTIHRREILQKLIEGASRERDVGVAAANSGLLTGRFMKNITNHIGIKKTTPGGKFGKPHRQYR